LHDAADAAFEDGDVEVNDRGEGMVGHFQLGENLGLGGSFLFPPYGTILI
jgi:hypothetical protein